MKQARRKDQTNENRLAPARRTRPALAPPEDLDAATFRLVSDEYLVLTFRSPVDLERFAKESALTPSEKAICTLVLRGHTNREIARSRGTSVGTIANQLSAIYRKLGVRSRGALGVIRPSPTKVRP